MSLKLDPKTTALVMIDLQKGILSMELAPYGANKLIENAVKLGNHFKEKKATIVAVHVAFAPDLVDRLSQSVDTPSFSARTGLPADWSLIDPKIEALGPDLVVTKRQWGAFFGTELDLQLRRRGINTIVLGGIATNFGVESTAREAWQHNYTVIIAEDMTTSIDKDMHDFAIKKIFPRIASVRSTEEIISAL